MPLLKEGQINRREGFLVFPDPKEKKPKIVFLLDEDRDGGPAHAGANQDGHLAQHEQGLRKIFPGAARNAKLVYQAAQNLQHTYNLQTDKKSDNILKLKG